MKIKNYQILSFLLSFADGLYILRWLVWRHEARARQNNNVIFWLGWKESSGADEDHHDYD